MLAQIPMILSYPKSPEIAIGKPKKIRQFAIAHSSLKYPEFISVQLPSSAVNKNIHFSPLLLCVLCALCGKKILNPPIFSQILDS